MWTASLVLGVATWALALGALAASDAQVGLCLLGTTFLSSAAGFTCALLSSLRTRGFKHVFTMCLNGVYLVAGGGLAAGAVVLSYL